MTVSEKVAYIQGLFDGLGLDRETSAEARVLSELLDVLRDVGVQLDALEDAVFDDDGDGGFDAPDGDFPLVPCPSCGEELAVDDAAISAGVVDCPVCGGRFALSFDDDE